MTVYETEPSYRAYDATFRKTILEGIEEALASFAAGLPQTVYFYLERDEGLKQQDIPYRPDVFSQALKRIFGDGAKFVEKRIVTTLYTKFGVRPDGKGARSFREVLKELRGLI